MILEESFKRIKTKYGDRFLHTTIHKVVAGIHYTAVQLSSGYCGLACTDARNSEYGTDSHDKGSGDFTPGHFSGQKLTGLFNHPDDSQLLGTIRLAAMNAMSAELIAESDYKIIENTDPIELVDLSGHKNICIVGAFPTYMKKIAETNHELQIVELDKNALPDDFKKYFIPADKAEEAFSIADIIIITGASLANNTLDLLLQYPPPEAQVILVGPTAGLLPEVLFEHKVNIIGSIRITDTDKMLSYVAEGASGFHLFRSCAQKICILRET